MTDRIDLTEEETSRLTALKKSRETLRGMFDRANAASQTKVETIEDVIPQMCIGRPETCVTEEINRFVLVAAPDIGK